MRYRRGRRAALGAANRLNFERLLDEFHFFSRKAFSTLSHYEFHLCSIAEVTPLNIGEVHKQIISVFLLNEAVAFLLIEPLYSTLRHTRS